MDSGEDYSPATADLVADFHRVSKLRSPSHLVDRPLSYGDLEHGRKRNENGFTLYSTQGERNIISVLRETDESNDKFIETSLAYIHERAGDALVGKYPELEETVKGILLKDSHTQPRKMNMLVHEKGEYSLRDLFFNLMPKRSGFLEGVKVPKELITVLDEPCAAGEGCYYKRTHFPHVGLPGPVCMSNEDVKMITQFPQLASPQIMDEVVKLLYQKLVPKHLGGGNGVKQHHKLCIVCICTQQAVNQMIYQGTNEKGEASGRDVFLIDIGSDPSIGMRVFPKKDYFKDLINATTCNVIQQARALNFDNYAVEQNEAGLWIARMINK